MKQHQKEALGLLIEVAILCGSKVDQPGKAELLQAASICRKMADQPPHLGEVLMECSEWAFGTFKPSSAEGVMAHLLEEWGEWMADPTDGEEAADVMMLMHHWFLLKGIDIRQELIRKLAINRARVWGKRQENGVVKHLEPPAYREDGAGSAQSD